MKLKTPILALYCALTATQAMASGYGVFTQGASGLGQANAVVAHPTGPSSLYFNPALLNDVPGRQVEIGTTAVFTERSVKLEDGREENAVDGESYPSSFYYTHQANEKITAGIGIFFPFGLSSEWEKDYQGRYIGTYAEMFSLDINPAVSWRVNPKLSLAAGLNFVYVDTDLRSMINQGAAYTILAATLGPLPPAGMLDDIEQKFTGDGWGHGFNLGALYKLTERIAIGAAYRSKVKLDVEGKLRFSGADPVLALAFRDSYAETAIDLPAQFVAGVATKVSDDLTVEFGVRWEDWDINDRQTLILQNPLLGETSISIDRNWRSTWACNLGGRYQVNKTLAISAGYLYGKDAVPDATFEPIFPDTDVHLLTVGSDLNFGSWTLSAAFGYEYHDSRSKNNAVGDPLGSLLSAEATGTANGRYTTDIYLLGLSAGYKF